MKKDFKERQDTGGENRMESEHSLKSSPDSVIKEWFYRIRTGWKWSMPLFLMLLVITFITGLWETIGAILTLFGLIWYIIRFRERQKTTGTNDFEVRFNNQHYKSFFYPVLIFVTGGFFMLSVDSDSGAFVGFGMIMENLFFLFFFGSIVLLITEFVLKGNWKRYRIPAFVSLVVFVTILEFV